MPFIFQTNNKSSSLDGKSRDELFEIFMIEIGQYKRLETGGVELSGEYMSKTEITDKFKDWLKKKSY